MSQNCHSVLGFLGRSTFQEDRSRELGNNVTQSFLNLPQSTPGGEIKQLPKLPEPPSPSEPRNWPIKQMFQPGYPNYPQNRRQSNAQNICVSRLGENYFNRFPVPSGLLAQAPTTVLSSFYIPFQMIHDSLLILILISYKKHSNYYSSTMQIVANEAIRDHKSDNEV